jgi:RNA polymerase sigma-70 factor (ECF subfamily)
MASMGTGAAEDRFTRLFDAHYGDVFRYVVRRVDGVDAADVVEDVFTTAWQHLDRIPDDPLPWLYRTAWHAIGNRRRATSRGRALLGRLRNEALTDTLGRDPADRTVARNAAARALQAMSPSDREAVRLVCWEQLSLTDAATVLGCSETALKVRLHRARQRLARLLDVDPTSDKRTPGAQMEATR